MAEINVLRWIDGDRVIAALKRGNARRLADLAKYAAMGRYSGCGRPIDSSWGAIRGSASGRGASPAHRSGCRRTAKPSTIG
jgi:hypothetical protein